MIRRAAVGFALTAAAAMLAGCGGVDDPLGGPGSAAPPDPPAATSIPTGSPGGASGQALDAQPCAAATDGANGGFYPGPAASPVYEALFEQGPAIPHLDTHHPQGLTVWADWDGEGEDLLLLGAYREGEPSYLIGIDPVSGDQVGTVEMPESHLGALGVVGDWLVAQHRDASAVRTYPIDDLAAAMREAAESGEPGELGSGGEVQQVAAANFMSVHDGRAWIGDYASDPATARMQEYLVEADGDLRVVGVPVPVPAQTQGVLVTEDRFVFVSGLRAGTVTVVERGPRRLADALGRCFASPSHGQNIVVHDGQVFVAFEGGSPRYAGEKTTANPITHLHVADYAELTQLR